jgi:hypothetical protein
MTPERLTQAIAARRLLQNRAKPYETTKWAMGRFEKLDPTIRELCLVVYGRLRNPCDRDDPYRPIDAEDLSEQADAYPVLNVLLNAPQILGNWLDDVAAVVNGRLMATAELRRVIGCYFTNEYNEALDLLGRMSSAAHLELLAYLNTHGVDLDDLLEQGPQALRAASGLPTATRARPRP